MSTRAAAGGGVAIMMIKVLALMMLSLLSPFHAAMVSRHFLVMVATIAPERNLITFHDLRKPVRKVTQGEMSVGPHQASSDRVSFTHELARCCDLPLALGVILCS